MAKKLNYIFAVGRRKSATARVRLIKGKGENLVNSKPISEYFPGVLNAALYQKPFDLTETAGKYYVSVKVVGGGKDGQLDAVIHGIARAFSLEDSKKFRSPLKKAGLLTRDSRIRQRRMVGTGGKARREKQSPKR